MMKERAKRRSSELARRLPVTEGSTPDSQDGSSFLKVLLNRFKKGRLFFIGILLFVVVGCVFLPSLRNDFVQWDDDLNIYSNPNIQKLDWPHLRWMFTNCSHVRRYIPVSWLNWAFVYHFFGLNPAVFHLESLLLHAANALLVFVLIRKLFERAFKSAGDSGALAASSGLAALLWGLHPLRTEAVAWANCELYPQSVILLLLSLLCYLRSIESTVGGSPLRSFRYWLAVILFALSLLTYPTGMPFVIVLVVLNVYPLGRLPVSVARWSNDLGARRVWLEIVPFALVTLPVVGITLWARTHATGIWEDSTMMKSFGWDARLSQAFYIWAYYLWKPWWPLNLSPVYTTLVWFDPVDRPFLLSAGLVMGLTGLVIWKRRQWPALLALWICYLGLLVPMLGLTEHPHYPSDRYSYIPAMLWSVLLAAGLFKLRCKPKLFAGSAAVAIVLIALLAAMSIRQIPTWRNSESLFEGILARLGNDPYRADIYCRLGKVYAARNRPDEAIRQYQEAIRLKPDFPEVYYNLGVVLAKKSQADEAIRQYQEAIRLKPDFAEAHSNLGVALAEKGRTDEAISQYQEAIRLKPDFAEAQNNLGYLWAEHGENLDQAREMIEKAVKLEPKNAAFLDSMGWVLLKLNRPREALDYLLKATENSAQPDASLYDHLGDIYAALNQREKAAEAWRKSLSVEPSRQIQKKLGDWPTD
jgi:protein O-mannosyl-transferase